jgi:hypothetical protein
MERLELGGSFGDAVSTAKLLEEFVGECNAFGWLGHGECPTHHIRDVTGKNIRGIFVGYSRRDRLKSLLLAEPAAEHLRV